MLDRLSDELDAEAFPRCSARTDVAEPRRTRVV